MPNPIITENQNIGTTAWQITTPGGTHVQAYVSASSCNPGDSINIYASVNFGSTFDIYVYRLGWYQGNGARLMTHVAGLTSVDQGHFDSGTLTLVNCPTAFVDATTGLCEARWASSYTLSIPSNWPTGVYLVLVQGSTGYQSYTKFIVRATGTEDYVVVMGDLTYAAYNNWGGQSLYTFNSFGGVSASKVSLDRPSVNQNGGDYLLRNDINWLKWSERQGYDIGYLSQIDLYASPGILNGHKVFVSPSHAEYWTKEERGAVEAFRDSGLAHGLGFLSGNMCYWQVRIETGGQNGANRTVTCYKVLTGASGGLGSGSVTPSLDPFYGVDNTRVTTQWRDPIVNRPEATLMGIMYDHITASGGTVYYSWVPASPITSNLFAGTGLVGGTSYGSDLVGNECDNIQASSPGNIQTLGASPFTTDGNNADTSNTTIYKAASGALVFAAGSIQWTWALDPFRLTPPNVPVVPGMQTFMANVMGALKGPVFSMVGV